MDPPDNDGSLMSLYSLCYYLSSPISFFCQNSFYQIKFQFIFFSFTDDTICSHDALNTVKQNPALAADYSTVAFLLKILANPGLLFVYCHPFLIPTSIIQIEKSVDDVLGI